MAPQPKLDVSKLQGLTPKDAWFLLTDRATVALEPDPDQAEQMARDMYLLDQPDDPLELRSLEDVREVLVGLYPKRGLAFFLELNPDFRIRDLNDYRPMEVLRLMLEMLRSDLWAMSH